MILDCAELNGLSGHEAGRKLLRELWQTHVGGKMPEIALTERGKPYFVDSPWHFSISHTKRRVFCALSPVPIGIDAEEADRDISLRLADKVLSPAEKNQFEAAADKRIALLKFWVLKEAAAKLSGEGLKGYPNHTEFSLNDPRVFETEGCIAAILTL
jgi:phosphopantetheinyl transferase